MERRQADMGYMNMRDHSVLVMRVALFACLLLLLPLCRAEDEDDVETLKYDPRADPDNPSMDEDDPDKEEEKEEEEEEQEQEEEREQSSSTASSYEKFLIRRLRADAKTRPKVQPLKADIYKIPGPQEPLPGRSHPGDYWPVFPFHSQYSGGLDLDPSISRHIGGDLNLAVPSWGILDIYGRFFNRIHDTTTKFGYMAHPVNMMDLEKEDLVQLMSNPSLQWNRNNQPRLPLGKLARSYAPLNCQPPMCNPYSSTFGFGVEQDQGGQDGVEGDIDVPLPISKGIAYRFPLSGKVYYDRDNVTITYGQHLSPNDPFHMFDYQKDRDPRLAIPRRRRRQIAYPQPFQLFQRRYPLSYPAYSTFPVYPYFGNVGYYENYGRMDAAEPVYRIRILENRRHLNMDLKPTNDNYGFHVNSGIPTHLGYSMPKRRRLLNTYVQREPPSLWKKVWDFDAPIEKRKKRSYPGHRKLPRITKYERSTLTDR